MKKVLSISLALVLTLAVLMPAPALAAKPVPFEANGIVYVTYISTPIPAGQSGRVRIETETLAGITISGPDALAGKFLALQQKSNELFSSADFSTAVALDGSSEGTFNVIDPSNGAVVVTGRYHLNVSNIPGVCQVYDQGNWSTTGNGQFAGRGTVEGCLNFIPAYGTFVGGVTFKGTMN